MRKICTTLYLLLLLASASTVSSRSRAAFSEPLPGCVAGTSRRLVHFARAFPLQAHARLLRAASPVHASQPTWRLLSRSPLVHASEYAVVEACEAAVFTGRRIVGTYPDQRWVAAHAAQLAEGASTSASTSTSTADLAPVLTSRTDVPRAPANRTSHAAAASSAAGRWKPFFFSTAPAGGGAAAPSALPTSAKSPAQLLGASATAWASGYRGAGIRIAVLDSGIGRRHPDVGHAVAERLSWVTDEDEEEGMDDPLADPIGHGTAVAGILAGRHPGCPGVAPEAKLYVHRVFDASQQTYTSMLLDALDHVLSTGIHIVTLSVGGPDWADTPFNAKVAEVCAEGVLVVSAVGNEGPGRGTTYNPGDSLCVLGVGAAASGWDDVAASGLLAAAGDEAGDGGSSEVEGESDDDDADGLGPLSNANDNSDTRRNAAALLARRERAGARAAGFSSRGPTLPEAPHAGAPVKSSIVPRWKPDLLGPGHRVTGSGIAGGCKLLAGSSMAAPAVAGAAALVWQALLAARATAAAGSKSDSGQQKAGGRLRPKKRDGDESLPAAKQVASVDTLRAPGDAALVRQLLLSSATFGATPWVTGSFDDEEDDEDEEEEEDAEKGGARSGRAIHGTAHDRGAGLPRLADALAAATAAAASPLPGRVSAWPPSLEGAVPGACPGAWPLCAQPIALIQRLAAGGKTTTHAHAPLLANLTLTNSFGASSFVITGANAAAVAGFVGLPPRTRLVTREAQEQQEEAPKRRVKRGGAPAQRLHELPLPPPTFRPGAASNVTSGSLRLVVDVAAPAPATSDEGLLFPWGGAVGVSVSAEVADEAALQQELRRQTDGCASALHVLEGTLRLVIFTPLTPQLTQSAQAAASVAASGASPPPPAPGSQWVWVATEDADAEEDPPMPIGILTPLLIPIAAGVRLYPAVDASPSGLRTGVDGKVNRRACAPPPLVLWDASHSHRYPLTYTPRNDWDWEAEPVLEPGSEKAGDPSQWRGGSHPHGSWAGLWQALVSGGAVVDIGARPLSCYLEAGDSAYNAVVMVDPEGSLGPREAAAYQRAVLEAGLGLLLVGDWGAAPSAAVSDARNWDAATRRWWTPVCAGAVASTLNTLLVPFGVQVSCGWTVSGTVQDPGRRWRPWDVVVGGSIAAVHTPVTLQELQEWGGLQREEAAAKALGRGGREESGAPGLPPTVAALFAAEVEVRQPRGVTAIPEPALLPLLALAATVASTPGTPLAPAAQGTARAAVWTDTACLSDRAVAKGESCVPLLASLMRDWVLRGAIPPALTAPVVSGGSDAAGAALTPVQPSASAGAEGVLASGTGYSCVTGPQLPHSPAQLRGGSGQDSEEAEDGDSGDDDNAAGSWSLCPPRQWVGLLPADATTPTPYLQKSCWSRQPAASSATSRRALQQRAAPAPKAPGRQEGANSGPAQPVTNAVRRDNTAAGRVIVDEKKPGGGGGTGGGKLRAGGGEGGKRRLLAAGSTRSAADKSSPSPSLQDPAGGPAFLAALEAAVRADPDAWSLLDDVSPSAAAPDQGLCAPLWKSRRATLQI